MHGLFAKIVNRATEKTRARNLVVNERDTYQLTNEERLARAIAELEAGHDSWLPWVYSFLAYRDTMLVRTAADTVSNYMKKLSTKQVIQWDDRFRSYSTIEYFVNWKTVNVSSIKMKIRDDETFRWVMRLGTFHPNGYFRENCIKELASDPASYPYLLLRLKDWVSEVRMAAVNACSDVSKLGPEDLMSCLSALEKVRRSARISSFDTNEIEKKIAGRIGEFSAVIGKDLISKQSEDTRRSLYRILLENKLISRDEVCGLLNAEKNFQNQRYIIKTYIERYEVPVEELDEFLEHKSTAVQRCAIEKKFAMTEKSWDGLEDKLLSPSFQIRETARYILSKDRNLDCRSYYIEHLNGDEAKYSILGLGETGKPEDAEFLMKYLEDPRALIVRNTLHSLGRLCGQELSELYWKYLTDERASVVKQAYINISGSHIRYGAKRIYELLENTYSESLKKKLLCLLTRESYWDRVPYLLMLYDPKDKDLHYLLDKGLSSSVVYSGVSEKQAKWICEILDDKKYEIPAKIDSIVRFALSYSRK